MSGRQESGSNSRSNQGGLLDHGDSGHCPNAPTPELRETKMRLHRVQERCVPAGPISAVGTWEWDSQTNEVHGSDETLALLGMQREKFAGTRDALATRIHPDDRAHWEHSLGGCIREGKGCRIECRVVVPDEPVRWIAILGDALRNADGQRRSVRGVVLDITERKQAERTLQENERFLEAIFESIQDGISVLSPDLTIRQVNDLIRRWYAATWSASMTLRSSWTGDSMFGLVMGIAKTSPVSHWAIRMVRSLWARPTALAQRPNSRSITRLTVWSSQSS